MVLCVRVMLVGRDSLVMRSTRSVKVVEAVVIIVLSGGNVKFLGSTRQLSSKMVNFFRKNGFKKFSENILGNACTFFLFMIYMTDKF